MTELDFDHILSTRSLGRGKAYIFECTGSSFVQVMGFI